MVYIAKYLLRAFGKKKFVSNMNIHRTRVFVTLAYFCRIFKHTFDEEKCIYM